MTILNHYLPFPAMISLLVKLLDYNNMSYAIILLTVLLNNFESAICVNSNELEFVTNELAHQ